MDISLKERVLVAYGNGKCACVKCGFSDARALSIDHINGKTIEQVIARHYGERLYLDLVRRHFPGGYQTLCMNCQFIKRSENQECRTTPERRIELKKLRLTYKYRQDKGLIPLTKGGQYFRKYIKNLPFRFSINDIYKVLSLDTREQANLRITVMRMKKEGYIVSYAKGCYEKVL